MHPKYFAFIAGKRKINHEIHQTIKMALCYKEI
jgi:hypothetical protein